MKPFDGLLWCFVSIFSLLALIVAADLYVAFEASPCRDVDAGPDCYPWGGEGPAAEYWYYRSKSIYLATGAVQVTASFIALYTMMISRDRRSAIHRGVVVSVLLVAAGIGLA